MGLPLESEPNFTVCLMSLFQICLRYAEIYGLRIHQHDGIAMRPEWG
jgi:hypothetical protein